SRLEARTRALSRVSEFGCPCLRELDSLGQRKLGGVIHRVGGAAHICAPGIRSGFPAPAGGLFTAERSADLGARRTDIDVGDPAVRSTRGHKPLGLTHVHREYTRR